MKVFFTFVPEFISNTWDGPPMVKRMEETLAAADSEFELCGTPGDADLILYLDPLGFKNRAEASILARQENIQRYGDNCFVWNYDIFPVAFLPGLYVSMPGEHLDSSRVRPWCYPAPPNDEVTKMEPFIRETKPTLLFSFRGVDTARVRREIFETLGRAHGDWTIVENAKEKFYSLSIAEKNHYAREILASKFVLCPRGIATGSHRLFETMQLGRVPVILADSWVAPPGPKWEQFSLRVPENNVASLPHLLREREAQAAEMGARARREWEAWFAPTPRLINGLRLLRDLKAQNPNNESAVRRQWFGWRFYWRYGLTKPQRVLQRWRDGTALEALKRRFR